MTKEESKETVRSFINILNSRDLLKLDDVCDDNMEYRVNTEVGARDLKTYKEVIQNSQNAFPDLEFIIEELIAEDNKVHMIYKLVGTHEGEYMGIKASKNKVELHVSAVLTIKNGKIIEQKEFYDSLTFLKQVDAVSD